MHCWKFNFNFRFHVLSELYIRVMYHYGIFCKYTFLGLIRKELIKLKLDLIICVVFRPFLCQLIWIISVDLVFAAAALTYPRDRHSRPLYISSFQRTTLIAKWDYVFMVISESRGMHSFQALVIFTTCCNGLGLPSACKVNALTALPFHLWTKEWIQNTGFLLGITT